MRAEMKKVSISTIITLFIFSAFLIFTSQVKAQNVEPILKWGTSDKGYLQVYAFDLDPNILGDQRNITVFLRMEVGT